jgi:hypothetical protein
MAKIKGGLFSLDAVGSIANLLSFQSGSTGGRVIRKPRTPTNAPQANRDKYAAACVAWNLLTTEERSTWNNLAAPLKLTGFNAFMRSAMLDNGTPVSHTYATLDSSKKSAAITLSNNDLTASSAAFLAPVLSTLGISTGRAFAEFVTQSASSVGIGAADSLPYTWVGEGADQAAWYPGYTGIWSSGSRVLDFNPQFQNGDIVGCGIDLSDGTLHFWVNGVSRGVAFSGLTGTQYFGVSVDSGASITANFGASPMAYPQAGWPEGLFTTP